MVIIGRQFQYKTPQPQYSPDLKHCDFSQTKIGTWNSVSIDEGHLIDFFERNRININN